jgi:hypothetical protein
MPYVVNFNENRMKKDGNLMKYDENLSEKKWNVDISQKRKNICPNG